MIDAVAIAFIIMLAGVFLYFAYLKRKKRHLPVAVRMRLRTQWEKLSSVQDDHRRIMEAEKIIEHALTTLGYRGTFADKLKAAGPRLSSVQSLWDAHKLRNRIAHEVGVHVSPKDAGRAVAAFERALRDLE